MSSLFSLHPRCVFQKVLDSVEVKSLRVIIKQFVDYIFLLAITTSYILRVLINSYLAKQEATEATELIYLDAESLFGLYIF